MNEHDVICTNDFFLEGLKKRTDSLMFCLFDFVPFCSVPLPVCCPLFIYDSIYDYDIYANMNRAIHSLVKILVVSRPKRPNVNERVHISYHRSNPSPPILSIHLFIGIGIMTVGPRMKAK